MKEIVFDAKDYCRLLKLEDSSQKVVLSGSDKTWPGDNYAVIKCQSKQACVTNGRKSESDACLIRVQKPGDIKIDVNQNGNGKYEISCSGCDALPEGFTEEVKKP